MGIHQFVFLITSHILLLLQAPGSIKDEEKLRSWLAGYEAEAIKVKMI